MDAFRREQRGVALAMAGALTVTILSLSAALLLAPGAVPASFAERLQVALRADLGVVIWLAAAIANVARLRFFSASDIAGSRSGSGTDKVRRAVAILQNTLEQVALAVFAHLALAASVAQAAVLMPVLVGLFAAGRLLFWLGYRYGARGRAFGFALTFYPSMLVLIGSGLALIAGGGM